MNRLPIIYIRGYAGATSGIDTQVDDPFYGFNEGATHIRVGGGDGDPMFYQFEGPMLRLMTDEKYELLVRGDQHAYLENAKDGKLAAASIWVYRFYDQAATTFAAPRHQNPLQRFQRHFRADGFDIEEAAEGLYDLIELVLRKTEPPEGAAESKKVILVAHSMGGLVARCMMEKICRTPDTRSGPHDVKSRRPASEIVDKFFTYGTPHGGIVFQSNALNWFEEVVGPAGSDIFAPEKMYRYLTTEGNGDRPPAGWDPQEIPKSILNLDDVFCLVGTDPKDYGPSKMVVGPKSDGLVRIENAYVRGAHRAFVYKSHSGRYGEVNSEEGYQNLRRFLFAKWKVQIDFTGLPTYQEQWPTWQADVRLSVRGLPIVISEQRADQYCPIQLNEELKRNGDNSLDTPDRPVPLLTTFLFDPADLRSPQDEEATAPHSGRARYSITLRVKKLTERSHGIDLRNHMEQVFDWVDSLIVDVGPQASGKGLQAWMAWNADVAGPIDRFDPITEGLSRRKDRKPVKPTYTNNGQWKCRVALPDVARQLPIFGDTAALDITITDRGVGRV
ncbi:esterase/lipase family protein [Nocardia sp. NPDC050408]|uniref:esterase/lipase family protein n=1 Tax=Nocardia sp. NPDC050408 TaxID=3364319 RepID=UPI0037BA1A56